MKEIKTNDDEVVIRIRVNNEVPSAGQDTVRPQAAQNNIFQLLDLINNQDNISVEAFDGAISLMKANGLKIDQTQTIYYFDSDTNTQISYQESLLISLFNAKNIGKAKILIKHGIDVNFFDPVAPYPVSPLSALINNSAIAIEDFDSLISLMKEHSLKMDLRHSNSYFEPSTNTQISYQASYLNNLFYSSNVEKAKILIKHGMDVNFVDRSTTHSAPPLGALTYSSNISIEDFESLIDLMKVHGLNMDQTLSSSHFDPTSYTYISYQASPLNYLLSTSNVEKAKILIKHGMDVNFVDRSTTHSVPPLGALIYSSHISIEDFESLIDLMKVHGLKIVQTRTISYHDYKTTTQLSYQESFLSHLIDKGYIEKAKVLIKHGMDVNFIDSAAPNPQSTFLRLIYSSDISIEDFNSLCGMMKEHGLKMDQTRMVFYYDHNTNIQLSYQESLLSYLICGGYVEQAKVLIKHGIDVNFVDLSAPNPQSPFLALINSQGNLKVSTIACKFSPEQEFVAIKHFPRFCNFL